jgi:hypothetical protein
MLRDRNSKGATGAAGAEFATEAAIAALGFLADAPERLERFLALSGLGPHNLRQAAAEPSFLSSVLDYIASDEALLVAFAAQQGLSPPELMRAREILAGPPPAET